jgi:SET domain-containing protein
MARVLMTEAKYSVRRSRIHGRGLFAVQAIAAGEIVAEYNGERIGKTESARRQARRKRIFIFELDASHDLDGGQPDNSARYANHSCAPNCEAVAEEGKVYLRALRNIAADEELTFDYGYRLAAFPGHPCRCGAKACAGFIVSQSERWRVRRLLHRPGRSLLAGRKMRSQEAKA